MTSASGHKPSVQLRPRALMAIGVTGHRNLNVENSNTPILVKTLDTLFGTLSRTLSDITKSEAGIYSNAEPGLRTICMAAEGADLLCMQAARTAGSAIVCVLPFAFEEYQKDYSSPSVESAARSNIERANFRFILPGDRAEGPRSYERANEVILANIDILVAIWDGKRANGRAGTGEMVQSAISRRIPVIVISPSEPAQPSLLIAPDEGELASPIATDLVRKPLHTDLAGILSKFLLPPHGLRKRQGLVDLLAEKTRYRNIRFEYPFLLKLFGVTKSTKAAPFESRPVAPNVSMPLANDASAASAISPTVLGHVIDQIDSLASHYALLYRSSATGEILVTIAAAFLSALALIFFPFIAGASLIAQMAVNGLVLVDAMIRSSQRWQERWLDYRVIVERLRCVRFLHPLGLGLDKTTNLFRHRDDSWIEWYVRRYERALDPTAGEVSSADITRFAQRLADGEIPEQLQYHSSTVRQLGALDHRLSAAGKIALATTIVVAALLGISAHFDGGIDNVAWKPVAIVCLFVLPAMATAFNGIRTNADLVRLVERSAITAATLEGLQVVIRSTTMTYDRVAIAAAKAADIMCDELSEWRFVLESRRVRTKRSTILARLWVRLRRRHKGNTSPA